MTRKLLSGVLAFAMVFGCTAPVALAEDTTVEEVEQYTVYTPVLEKTTVYVGAKTEEKIKVADVSADATITWTGDVDTLKEAISIEFDNGYLVVKGLRNLSDAHTAVITFSKAGDHYQNSVTLTVKPVEAAPKVTLSELSPAGNVKVGSSVSAEAKVTKSGETVAPDSVEVTLNDFAKKFYDYTVTDVKTGDKVTGKKISFTGTKVMTDADKAEAVGSGLGFKVKVTATYGTVKETKTYTLPEVVADYTLSPISISLSSNTNEVTVGAPAKLAVKVGMSDGFGGVVYDDDAPVVWYVNGTKIAADGKVTDILGNQIATLTKDSAVTAATFSAAKAGTYKITVETADGNYSGSKTITVKNAAMTAIDTLHIASATDWSVDDKTGGIKVTTPGTTVDLSGIRFAGREDVTGTTKPGHPIADFGIAVTGYAVENAVVDGKVIAGEAVAKKAVSVDAKGLVTVADESNTVMKELLTLAKGKDITFNIIVSFKNAAGKTYSLWDQTPVQVVVTKPSEKAASIELYLDGKKVDTTKSVVLSVGKTYDFDVLVKDAHGYSDAVDQRVVWQIDGNSDKTVYATVDQSGVVTPLQASIESASLKVASITGTTAPVTVKLIIVGEATKPTEKPTEAPTQAPETKTGTVNTSSSALNIRAAASTGATVVAKAAKGSTVTILGEENGFYKVKLADGTVGYASKAYIKVTTDTPVVTITATTTANLKLRTSAPSGSVITVMPKGATVKVIEGGQSWAKVEYNGKVGYASNNYLTFNTVG